MAGAVAVVGFASIGGVLFGLDQGNWGGAIVKEGFVKTFCEPHCGDLPLSECNCHDAKLFPSDYETWLQFSSGLLQGGAAVGALLVAPFLASRLGRRETMFVGAALTAAGVLPCMFVTSYSFFLMARFVAGVGVGNMTYALPMYIAEVAPAQIRGILGSMMQLSANIGQLFASVMNLNPGFQYWMSFSLPAFPAAVVAAGIFFFPMSPRFALLKFKRLQKPEEGIQRAKNSLKRLRGNEVEADKELWELQQAMEAETAEAPWSTLLTDKSILRRVLIANFLQWGQQFTGVNAILSYGPSIFIDAGVEFTGDHTQDGLIAAALVNLVLLCSVIGVMFVIDVWGRRFLLLLGGGIMFVSMTTAAVLAKMIDDMGNDPSMAETKKMYAYMLVGAICFYVIGFGPWGAIPWVYPSEIFPMDVKEKALSTSVFSQWSANCIIAIWCVGQVSSWGSWGTLAFYSVCCGVVLLMAAFFVPEIKGVRMEDMDSIFGARRTGPQEPLAEA
jgi:sugar porter (SP) family MFS transporter